MPQPDPGEHLADGSLQILFLDPSNPQRQRDIVEGGQVSHQPEILEHHPDPSTESRQALARHGDDIFAEQLDQPTAGPLRKIEQLQK